VPKGSLQRHITGTGEGEQTDAGPVAVAAVGMHDAAFDQGMVARNPAAGMDRAGSRGVDGRAGNGGVAWDTALSLFRAAGNHERTRRRWD